jgi:type II secretory pathway pseudopilin PulG
MTVSVASRRGITLLEVLVSLGILSIGLACVVALLPAGASEAKKAMDADRRSAVAAAATADAITRGILNPATWTPVPASTNRPAILVDPLGANGLVSASPAAGLTAVTLGNFGAGTVAADEVFRSQDDLVYDTTQSDDEPPVPKFYASAGKRASKGTFSWLATLVPATTDALPQFFRLSIVVCNRRGNGVAAVAPLAGTLSPVTGTDQRTSTRTATFNPGMTSETFRDVCPAGAVVLLSDGATTWAWRRLLQAAPLVTSGLVTGARFSFDHDVSSAADRVHLVQGAIGYAEHFVTLERNSSWTR